jgi:hypothetical protein
MTSLKFYRNPEFDRKFDMYKEVRTANQFRAVWSLYEVEDFGSAHPFSSHAVVKYVDHWGDGENTTIAVEGSTWLDLYKAADQAIRNSGDGHHVYIEKFAPSTTEQDVLYLHTGS